MDKDDTDEESEESSEHASNAAPAPAPAAALSKGRSKLLIDPTPAVHANPAPTSATPSAVVNPHNAAGPKKMTSNVVYEEPDIADSTGSSSLKLSEDVPK